MREIENALLGVPRGLATQLCAFAGRCEPVMSLT